MMRRPALFEAQSPIYQTIFMLTLLGIATMLGLGAIHAWRIFQAPPGIAIDPIIMGDRLMREKNYEAALREYEKTITVDPGNFEAWSRMGTIQGILRNHPLELEYYERALKVRPTEPMLVANAGRACLKMKRLDEAIAYFRTALRFDPNSVDVHLNLGAALGRSGDPAAAIPHFERVVELEPDNNAAKENLKIARNQAAKARPAN